jgi:hypothetical protein
LGVSRALPDKETFIGENLSLYGMSVQTDGDILEGLGAHTPKVNVKKGILPRAKKSLKNQSYYSLAGEKILFLVKIIPPLNTSVYPRMLQSVFQEENPLTMRV